MSFHIMRKTLLLAPEPGDDPDFPLLRARAQGPPTRPDPFPIPEPSPRTLPQKPSGSVLAVEIRARRM